MKVKELIAKLQEFDQDADVLCYSEENVLVAENHVLRVLDIDGVSNVEAEKCRGEDQVPTIKIGSSDNSQELVIIEVLAEF